MFSIIIFVLTEQICEPIFEKGHFPTKYLITQHVVAIFYKRSITSIWYPGRAIIMLLRYHISFTSCTKWQNDDQLHVSVDQKILEESVPF